MQCASYFIITNSEIGCVTVSSLIPSLAIQIYTMRDRDTSIGFTYLLTSTVNILRKENCEPRREEFELWDLMCLILEILRYVIIILFWRSLLQMWHSQITTFCCPDNHRCIIIQLQYLFHFVYLSTNQEIAMICRNKCHADLSCSWVATLENIRHR